MAVYQVASYEYIALAIGSGFAVILAMFFFIVMKWTPAKAFMKAKFSNGLVVQKTNRAGRSEYLVATDADSGTIDVEKYGSVFLEKGSHAIESRSKVPVVHVFGEYGISIPSWWPSILQELKEAGIRISNNDDYTHILKLSKGGKYADKYISSFKDKVEKKKARELVKNLQKYRVFIKPFKAYRLHELADQFPNNVRTEYTESKVEAALTYAQRNDRFKRNAVIAFGGIAVLFLAAGIAWKMIGNATPCPAPIIQTIETGVRTVAANATSGSITV